MDLTFKGETTKQTKEKAEKKKERGREEIKKKIQKMYVYISHILVSSTQKMLVM